MKSILCALFAAALLTAGCGVPPMDEKAIEAEVRDALQRQVASWNEGSMDGYLGLYWRSDSLTFHSGKEKLAGWETVASMYNSKYSGRQRGKLEFRDTALSVLGPESVYVTGQWVVELPDTVRSGRFTIILRRFEEGWRIVHDHSS